MGADTLINKMRKEEKERRDEISSLKEMESILYTSNSQDTEPFVLSCNMSGASKYKVSFDLTTLREAKFPDAIKAARMALEKQLEEFYDKRVGERGSTVRQALDWSDFTSTKKDKSND